MSQHVFGHRFRNARMAGGGGFGAIAQELLKSRHTAKVYGYRFGFIRDGLEYHELFGTRNWLDFFEGRVVNRCDIEWPSVVADDPEPVSFEGTRREWYRIIAQEIFTLRPDIQHMIDARITQSGFLESDCVIHVRRTDKITEAPLVNLETYAETIVKYVPPGTRIFLLSDDPSIRMDMQQRMQERGYPLVWSEADTTIHCQRLQNSEQFSEDALFQEVLMAIQLMIMMSRAQYLIGARISMLFRMGEILNPNQTVNLSDFDINHPFGSASYIVPVLPLISLPTTNRILRLPDFLPVKGVEPLVHQFSWWETVSETQKRSTQGRHYLTCGCCLCRLKNSFREKTLCRTLEQLTGKSFHRYLDICLIHLSTGGELLESIPQGHLIWLVLTDKDLESQLQVGNSSSQRLQPGELVLIQNPMILKVTVTRGWMIALKAVFITL